MIIDGTTATEGHVTECDILIVGSGPAGVTLAMELEKSGLRVILLESGGEDFDDRAQELNDGSLSELETTDLIAGRLRLLGGTSNHWGGHCLPLDRIDFSRPPLSGLTGWPMSYDDMRDAYIKASDYCDIGAFDYSLDSIATLDSEDLLLSKESQIETKAIRQSHPTNFGKKYINRLKLSKTVHLWLWTTAVGIEIDETGYASEVLTRNIENTARRFTAKQVVLACGAIENARLLLANNARLNTSFGDQGGYLGTCYMDHTVGGAAFLHLDTPIAAKAYWSDLVRSNDGINLHLVWRLSAEVLARENLNNTQFFLIPFSNSATSRRLKKEANEGLDGLKSIVKWVLGRDQRGFQLSSAYCSTIMNADALAVHSYQKMTGAEKVDRLLLRYEAEQLPDKSSYVALSDTVDALGMPKPRLNWSPSLADRDSIVRSAIIIGQIVGASGLGRIELEKHFAQRYWDASTAWHQLGTTRMAPGASDGVVDFDSRLHGTKNVYVTGGSVFPSGGRANPTLTIVALAVILADHLVRRQEG